MDIMDVVGKLTSRKMGIAFAGIGALLYIKAPSWQIMALAAVAIAIQGMLDYKDKANK